MPRSPTQNLLASVTLRLNTNFRGHHTEFSPELCMVSPELSAGIQDLLRIHRGRSRTWPGFSFAARRASTAARSSGRPAQACSRNAARSSGT